MRILDSKEWIVQKVKKNHLPNKPKNQVQDRRVAGIVAVLFIGTGIALGNVSARYGEAKEEEKQAEALAIQQQEEALAAAFVPEMKKESKKTPTVSKKEEKKENQPKPYEPAPDKLNLAYFYPEDAESEEIIDSYAGQVFQELTIMDLDWLADLYELSDISPSTMASRLGKGTKAIMGGYNPRDKTHKANNPSSWVIHDWKKIHVQFVDGDGRPVNAFSNVKDILSMASVYTYYTDMMDVDAFAEYSRQLWKASHSYSLSMGDVYYCSGCLNKTEEELVREAEEDELAAEKIFSGTAGEAENQNSSPTELSGESGVSGMITGSHRDASGPTESFEPSLAAETVSSESSSAAETVSSESTEPLTETSADFSGNGEVSALEGTAGNAEGAGANPSETSQALPDAAGAGSAGTGSGIGADTASGQVAGSAGGASVVSGQIAGSADGTGAVSGQIAENMAGGNGVSGQITESTAETETQGNPSSVSGSVIAASPSEIQENSGNSLENGAGTPDEDSLEADAKKRGKKTQYDCPGHVDLSIRVKILGLDEKKNLFSLAKAAEQKKWDGWKEENIAHVKKISSQDWFDDYGLSVSSFSLSTPLTNQEIDGYMNQLPADTSVTRRNIIHFALSSVGRVPYYWGGKASFAGYEGNHFGALIPADDKGRMLRGLDCSGWVSWVYWSATGKRLAGESTSSLCLCGKQISRSELQPGDIIVRTGAGAHVVMFLSWSADGRMNVIHETSGSMNNVAIATMDAPWPYYRKLVE